MQAGQSSGNLVFVFAGDGELGISDIEKVNVNIGYCSFVDQVGAMDAGKVGIQDGFPLGDGCSVPETPVARGYDSGNVVVRLNI